MSIEVQNDKLDKRVNNLYKQGKSYAEWQRGQYQVRVEHHEFRVPKNVEENRFRKDEEWADYTKGKS